MSEQRRLSMWLHVAQDINSIDTEVLEDNTAVLHIECGGWWIVVFDHSPGELVRRLREAADGLERQYSAMQKTSNEDE